MCQEAGSCHYYCPAENAENAEILRVEALGREGLFGQYLVYELLGRIDFQWAIGRPTKV